MKNGEQTNEVDAMHVIIGDVKRLYGTLTSILHNENFMQQTIDSHDADPRSRCKGESRASAEKFSATSKILTLALE